MKRALKAAALCALIALAPMLASAQEVTAPGIDAATLRKRLEATMLSPNVPMPNDRAGLDAMLSQGQDLPLRKRLQSATTASDILADMDWEQANIFSGSNWLIAYAYTVDAWRLGSALPQPQGDQLKRTAGMFFLYSLAVALVDGSKCSDASAPGHRIDQLVVNNAQIAQYLVALPRADRMMLGSRALGIETATASVRPDDEVLCSGGLEQMGQGLAAQGNKPLKQVPNSGKSLGKTYEVPSAPNYKPGFVGAEQWRPKQMQVRQSLPATLTRLLTPASERAPAVP